MKREDFVTAFAELSAEEQESIRAELLGELQGGWNPKAMCRQMMQQMKCCGQPSSWGEPGAP